MCLWISQIKAPEAGQGGAMYKLINLIALLRIRCNAARTQVNRLHWALWNHLYIIVMNKRAPKSAPTPPLGDDDE